MAAVDPMIDIRSFLMSTSDFLATRHRVQIDPGREILKTRLLRGVERGQSLRDPQFLYNILLPTVWQARDAAGVATPVEDMIHDLLVYLHGDNWLGWRDGNVSIPSASELASAAAAASVDPLERGTWPAPNSGMRSGMRPTSILRWLALVAAFLLAVGAGFVVMYWGPARPSVNVNWRGCVPYLLALSVPFLTYVMTKSKGLTAYMAVLSMLALVLWVSKPRLHRWYVGSATATQAADKPSDSKEPEGDSVESEDVPESVSRALKQAEREAKAARDEARAVRKELTDHLKTDNAEKDRRIAALEAELKGRQSGNEVRTARPAIGRSSRFGSVRSVKTGGRVPLTGPVPAMVGNRSEECPEQGKGECYPARAKP